MQPFSHIRKYKTAFMNNSNPTNMIGQENMPKAAYSLYVKIQHSAAVCTQQQTLLMAPLLSSPAGVSAAAPGHQMTETIHLFALALQAMR